MADTPNALGEAHRAIIESLDWSHTAGHLISLGSIGAVLAGFLPGLAALGAVVWYSIAIWETRTVRHWRQERARAKAARIARHARGTVKAAAKVAKAIVETAAVEAAAKVDRASVAVAKLEDKQP